MMIISEGLWGFDMSECCDWLHRYLKYFSSIITMTINGSCVKLSNVVTMFVLSRWGRNNKASWPSQFTKARSENMSLREATMTSPWAKRVHMARCVKKGFTPEKRAVLYMLRRNQRYPTSVLVFYIRSYRKKMRQCLLFFMAWCSIPTSCGALNTWRSTVNHTHICMYIYIYHISHIYIYHIYIYVQYHIYIYIIIYVNIYIYVSHIYIYVRYIYT